MRTITALLLLCVSAFSFAAPRKNHNRTVMTSLAQLLFNDPNSPRTGAKEPKLTIVSFTDYNCPYCKQFDPLLEKIVHDNPTSSSSLSCCRLKGRVR
ncbi:secreted protein, suppressor for copper-sensitivity ScsC [Klebsiella pneumoniae]|uniref:Secreted protein, suppressor for copper-sensitivity ScsC n=1 Tax=Klebsiella pneumoniae TaxID=573 RepID=A0A377V7U1_KLEPN|nr:secreted protein, suppressor for copper-sensitivity ScsC [Klebsiella pneumoniae]